MRKIYTSLLFLFSVACSSAQVSVRDSLLKRLPQAKEDTATVMLYINIGGEYENSEPVKARQYYQKAMLLSKEIGDKRGYYKSISLLGNTYLLQGNQDSMIYLSKQALELARDMKDSVSIGMSLFNIGIAYRNKSDFEKAIDYCLQGRRILEGKGNTSIEMQINDALQVLYYNRTEYDKAIVFGEKALMQAKELKRKGFGAQVMINLSMSYIQKKQIDKARLVLLEAIGIGKELQDKRIETVGLTNLAEISLKARDYLQAKNYTEKVLAMYRELGSVDGETTALRGLGICNLQLGNYSAAKEFAEQALLIDRKNNYRQEEAAALRLLSSVAYANQDLSAGFEYDDEGLKILELMIKEVLSKQSAELDKKYESQKKEDQIKQLEIDKKLQQLSIKQKNTLNYFLIAGTVTLFIISLLLYRNYRQKQKLQQQRITELETQQQLTATEAVLKGEEQERTRLAKDLHDGLGGMLSGIKYSLNTMKGNLIMTPDNHQAFERSMDMLDSSIKEMRRVAHNMMPEALVKFGLNTALIDFCNDINQSGALQVRYQSIGLENAVLDPTAAITIYRIVQELINNVLKHAAAKTAIVQLSKTNGTIAVTVEDDGKGFDTGILKQSKGIGWSNIQSRVDFLKGNLDVQSQAGKGTSVHIELTA
jgi:two-component system, NarL family, sensor kinase